MPSCGKDEAGRQGHGGHHRPSESPLTPPGAGPGAALTPKDSPFITGPGRSFLMGIGSWAALFVHSELSWEMTIKTSDMRVKGAHAGVVPAGCSGRTPAPWRHGAGCLTMETLLHFTE